MRLLCLLVLAASFLPAQSQAVLAGLATGSYFPLGLGDRWVYRIDDRQATGAYQTWRVDRLQEVGGATYVVMAIEGPDSFYWETWFRPAAGGKIYILTGKGEHPFLDPSGQPAPEADLQVTGQGGTVSTALGSFPDTLTYRNNMGLILETGALARGVGLLSSTAILTTGSSGGIVQRRTLVEAAVGGIRFTLPAPSVQLGMESLNLNVSGREADNCAMPCYFAACAIAGADPPGTYKPCARARVALINWPADLSRTVRLRLLAPGGEVVNEQALTLDAAPGESVVFVRVPLYSAPNEPLPPGAYRLAAQTADGAGESSLAVKIR